MGADDKQPARERHRKRTVGIMNVRGISLMNLKAAVRVRGWMLVVDFLS